jgi:hypothetical protein
MLMIAGVRAAHVDPSRAYTVERVSARPDPGLFTSHYLIRQKSSSTLLAGARGVGKLSVAFGRLVTARALKSGLLHRVDGV